MTGKTGHEKVLSPYDDKPSNITCLDFLLSARFCPQSRGDQSTPLRPTQSVISVT